jgi:TolB protein
MNKQVLSQILFVLFAVSVAFAGPQMIAFERNDAVWIANLDGTGEKKIADGIFPAISPDGTRVAITTVEKQGETYIRHIAVADVASGAITTFNNVPSTNVYYPSWSSDGKRVLFTARRDDVWDIVSAASDGSDFRVIKKGEPNKVTLYSPCWARDGQSVFVEDMEFIYQIGLDGNQINRWKIEQIVPHGGMSGDCRLATSADGKQLLLSIEMGDQHHRKDWDGPHPAIWSFDLAAGKSKRVTPDSMWAWDACWLDSANILCLNQPVGEKEPSIYRVGIDGKNPKRLIKHARFPSVTAP